MRRFRYLYRMEKLPHEPIASAEWYASDFACGALVWVGKGKNKARLKGAVTAPEARGQGHGQAMLLHRLQVAQEAGATMIEVYARHPAWFLRNGFELVRVTKWGVSVLAKRLK
jgi:N-acetylglutamate synthase-like GNAT family acetyltransferase